MNEDFIIPTKAEYYLSKEDVSGDIEFILSKIAKAIETEQFDFTIHQWEMKTRGIQQEFVHEYVREAVREQTGWKLVLSALDYDSDNYRYEIS
jgi:hypothetical protein